jgi:hypothetical protein
LWRLRHNTAISLELLKKKCGSASDDYEFRRLLTAICNEDQQHNHMPDYAIAFDGDTVRFSNRKAMKAPAPDWRFARAKA